MRSFHLSLSFAYLSKLYLSTGRAHHSWSKAYLSFFKFLFVSSSIFVVLIFTLTRVRLLCRCGWCQSFYGHVRSFLDCSSVAWASRYPVEFHTLGKVIRRSRFVRVKRNHQASSLYFHIPHDKKYALGELFKDPVRRCLRRNEEREYSVDSHHGGHIPALVTISPETFAPQSCAAVVGALRSVTLFPGTAVMVITAVNLTLKGACMHI